MRRFLLVLGVLVLVLVVAVVAAVMLIDAERFREPIRQYASDALGREVKLGALDLTLLPLPAIRASGIEIAGHRQGEKPFAQVDELRLRVAVLPLLARRLVLRSVDLDAPRIHVPFDGRGDPILPGPAAQPGKKPKAAGDAPERPAETGSQAAEPVLAIDRIRVSNASVDAGPYKLRGGDVDGSFTLGGAARFDVQIDDVAFAQDDLSVSGPVSGELALGESFSLDLDGMAIRSGDAFRKPAGERLRVRGPLGSGLDASALSDVTVQLGRNEFPLTLRLTEPRMQIRVRPTRIDLAGLKPFLAPDTPDLGGTLDVEAMTIKLDPLALDGKAALSRVTVPLDGEPIEITGPVVAQGQLISLSEATALAGDTPISVAGSYDLGRGVASFEFDTSEAQAQSLMEFFAGRSELSGVLRAGGQFRIRGGMKTLDGTGSFAITPGQIRGFSLVRQVLGPLTDVALLTAQLKGKDLSRYQEENFERLSADYRIDGGVLHTDNLVLAYRYATANLRGSVNLDDLALDLRGEVVLTRELDSELAGEAAGRRRVIPIANIRGTALSPRVNIDGQTVAGLAAAYLGQDRVQNKLQEKLDGKLGEKIDKTLGPGGREAVKGILDTLLGAPPAREKAPATAAPGAPATEAPATEAPATQVPATEAPAETPPAGGDAPEAAPPAEGGTP